MISTYLLAVKVGADSSPWIEPVTARSYDDAKDKFIQFFVDTYGIPYPLDWDELEDTLMDYDICIGDVYNIDEF